MHLRRSAVLFVAALVCAGLAPATGLVAANAAPGRGLPDATFRAPTQVARHAPGRPLGTLAVNPRGLEVAKTRAAAAAAGLATATSVTSAPVVGLGFDGQRDPRVTPSDSTGAIGPDRYIQTVNLRYGIYDRGGAVLSQGNLSALAGVPRRPDARPVPFGPADDLGPA